MTRIVIVKDRLTLRRCRRARRSRRRNVRSRNVGRALRRVRRLAAATPHDRRRTALPDGPAVEAFAATARAIAATSGKLEKTALLAEYLATLGDADLAAAVHFFTGGPFAANDRRTLSLGGRSIASVARRVVGVRRRGAERGVSRKRRSGHRPRDARASAARRGIFDERLTPASLSALFGEIGNVTGERAGKRREAIFERILRSLRRSARRHLRREDCHRRFARRVARRARARRDRAGFRCGRRRGPARDDGGGDVGAVAVAARHGRRSTSCASPTERRSASCSHRRSLRRIVRRARRRLVAGGGQVRRHPRAGARARR